jgi:hypothetical protein
MSAGVKVTLLRVCACSFAGMGKNLVAGPVSWLWNLREDNLARHVLEMSAEQRLMARGAASGPGYWQRTLKHKGV